MGKVITVLQPSRKKVTAFKADMTQKANRRKMRLLSAKASVDAKQKRIELARQSRVQGARADYPFGGAHSMVQAWNKAVRSHIYLESNHSPPEASYRGSPWADVPSGERPAHSMVYYHHRSPSGSVGGASSTGGSGVQPGWTNDILNEHMRAGNFHLAMKQDFIDLLNTTAPNRGFYALALYRTAVYARLRGFIQSDAQLEDVISVLGHLLVAEDLQEATATAEAMLAE